ncbi:hypothetical protein SCMU_13780 [Sinomonas cyclohexanicum]|uniref:Uncharacterized protein n=1 Tax=Sinomonas cyclohexanicum TaxID=322009 RepID=A0ABM7PTP6_SINCY|nr:hypothetical protein SCMU_13780 [Corynebacterium cyclohexanicum]
MLFRFAVPFRVTVPDWVSIARVSAPVRVVLRRMYCPVPLFVMAGFWQGPLTTRYGGVL